MNWYYARGKEKKGPVDDDGLAGLVKTGEVKPDTLVWHEGMEAWKAFSEVEAERSGMLRCAFSGEMREREGMLQYGDKWVAAEHKEAFVQALQEGRDVAGDEATSMFYVGFWWRVLASVIDWAVKLVPSIIFGIPFYIWYIGFIQEMVEEMAAGGGAAGLSSGYDAYLTWQYGVMVLGMFGFSIVYETWMVGKYGATVGKRALGFKVVNADGSKVSMGRAFGRWWAEVLVKFLTFFVGYLPIIIVTLTTGIFTATEGAPPAAEEGAAMMIASLATLLLLPLGAFGYWMAGVTKEKKALHDVICKTRVVRKA
ncbi:MAG: RDD family protein [Verrucomicrobiales bacterium]|nr:RDD family protein [Verrucomicrobiales bacterium]